MGNLNYGAANTPPSPGINPDSAQCLCLKTASLNYENTNTFSWLGQEQLAWDAHCCKELQTFQCCPGYLIPCSHGLYVRVGASLGTAASHPTHVVKNVGYTQTHTCGPTPSSLQPLLGLLRSALCSVAATGLQSQANAEMVLKFLPCASHVALQIEIHQN
jgi:hypothetical protein